MFGYNCYRRCIVCNGQYEGRKEVFRVMELIYFFIGLGIFGTAAYIWARWFYKESENEHSKEATLQAEK